MFKKENDVRESEPLDQPEVEVPAFFTNLPPTKREDFHLNFPLVLKVFYTILTAVMIITLKKQQK